MKKTHIGQLDGYRGFAAMIVVVSHFSNRALADVDIDAIFQKSPVAWTLGDIQSLILAAFGNGAGQIGVMIFFSLSAFLMFHLYFDSEVTGANIKNFFVSRVARIIPLYYLTVLIAVLWTVKSPYSFIDINQHEIIGHLTFVQGNSVLWTIAPELLFYLVFSAIWWRFQGRKKPMAIVTVGLIVLANSLPVAWKSYTFEFFLTGYLAYIYFHSPYRLKLGGFGDAVATCLFALGIFVHLPAVHKALFGAPDTLGWQEIHYALLILFLFITVIDTRWLNAFFSSRPLRYLGKISFSLYLLHLIIINGMMHYNKISPTLLSLALAIIMSVSLSAIIYHFYEHPARTFIRGRYSYLLSRQSGAP